MKAYIVTTGAAFDLLALPTLTAYIASERFLLSERESLLLRW